MTNDPHGIGDRLQTALARPSLELERLVEEQRAVCADYSAVFVPDRVESISTAEFERFVTDARIRRRWGIPIPPASEVSDLRRGLSMLVDDRHRVADRLDWLEGKGGGSPVKALPMPLATAVLHVTEPRGYAVWSPSVDAALRHADLYPPTRPGSSRGEQYGAINRVMLRTADDLGTDPGTLEAVCWLTERRTTTPPRRKPATASVTRPRRRPVGARRGLEVGETFVCTVCFQTKALVLRSDDGEDVCVDCA